MCSCGDKLCDRLRCPEADLCVGRTGTDVSSARSFFHVQVSDSRLVQVMETLLMTLEGVSTHSCQLSQSRSASVPFSNPCE